MAEIHPLDGEETPRKVDPCAPINRTSEMSMQHQSLFYPIPPAATATWSFGNYTPNLPYVSDPFEIAPGSVVHIQRKK